MRPTVKRTVIASLMATALVAGSTLPGFAAETVEMPPSASTDTVATNPVAPESEEASKDSLPTTNPNAEATTESSEPKADKQVTEAPAPANLKVESATTEPATGSTATETAPAKPAAEAPKAADNRVVEAYANWDFRRSFREYVGFENETFSEGLGKLEKGNHLLWLPKPGQTFDATGTTGKLEFAGKIGWLKYDGLLDVQISNLTLDLENRVLLVDGYTAGTMARAGKVEFKQQAIATLPDLQVQKHDGYVVISSLKPVFTSKIIDLVGLYKDELAAPLVITVNTANNEEKVTPQPVLWELFPDQFKNPINGPVYSDEPLRNVNIPDPQLEKCIRSQYDVAAGIPITNKVLEGMQALKCPGLNIEKLDGLESAINLTSVSFYANKLTSLAPLKNSTKLVDIDVDKNRLTSLSGLENSTRIQNLNASENYLTDVSVVKKLGYLSSVNLSHNRITDISQLAVTLLDDNNDKLQTLDLSHNRISDLSAINDLPYVRNLDLSHNLITEIGALAHKRALEKLNLEYNFITDPSPLGKWASQSWRRGFTQLKIRFNKFTDWSSLEDLKSAEDFRGDKINKVYSFPAPGEEESLVNPNTIEDINKKNSDQDTEIEKILTPPAPKPDDSSNPKNPGEVTPPPAAKHYIANLQWGIKESFTRYIKGPIAHGTWELSNGATGQFDFPLKPGFKVNPNAVERIDFGGTVHFKGHGGLLDLAISEPTIEKVNDSWQLVATVTSRPFNQTQATPTGFLGRANKLSDPVTVRSAIANLSAPVVTSEADVTSLAFNDVILTESGSEAFAKFYPTGQKLDGLVVKVKASDTPGATDSISDGAHEGGKLPTPDPNTPDPKDPAPKDPNTPDPKDPAPKDPKDPGKTPNPNVPDANVPAFVADLHWGLKQSFRSYVKGPIAGGNWTVSDGVTGEFVFPLVPGTTIDPKDYSKIDFAGKVHFTGHKGLLDLTISNPTLQKVNGNWELVATVASAPFDKANVGKVLSGGFRNAPNAPVPTRIVIANLSAPVISKVDSANQITFNEVTLTAAGAKAFSDFYPAGQKLDPLTVVLRPADVKIQPEMPKKPDVAQPNKPLVPAPAQPAVPGTKPAPKPTPKQCTVDTTKQRITGGNLAWGLRASFTNYVRGSIAAGGWQLSGTSWDGANFNWAATGGVYNTVTKTGTVYYAGSVRFTGHKGILDLTISNPTIEINGNSGALYLTVAGSDMKGNKFNLGRVHFANLTFSGVAVNGGALNLNAPSVTLTAAGAKAFAGFYNAGEVLAPLGSSLSITTATACDPVTGELIEFGAFGKALPATGAELEALLLVSLLTLLGGVAALAVKPRRVK
ncbi:HtaA domain-containing protein [Gleimia sp. 6138-11-ORH1]|uniref:HtaA domain-containing protein n=1 Tax=Gleimia sp. 6138-11-ORH1 TaxID=2973937 RepID=UPI002168B893|nr:HtaA domain-containing protein [Gleimia sp. 6138-11-ORH1]MCS4484385.1 HtaA domain-containing protein [Gleimia sp. 6138-11-ORH1]